LQDQSAVEPSPRISHPASASRDDGGRLTEQERAAAKFDLEVAPASAPELIRRHGLIARGPQAVVGGPGRGRIFIGLGPSTAVIP
jgi:hypothetical protein